MKNRDEIINYLIQNYNLESYLEIGLDDGSNFKKINCKIKESVDPYIVTDHNRWDLIISETLPDEISKLLTYRLTSDEFFECNNKKYDLIFIDGLHTEEQVGKDIINSLKILNDNGFIIVHDCIPRSYEAQIVPRIQSEWNGDVWKAIVELTKQGIKIDVLNEDFGIGIIRKVKEDSLLYYPKKSELTWDDFSNNKEILMSIINEKEFKLKYV